MTAPSDAREPCLLVADSFRVRKAGSAESDAAEAGTTKAGAAEDDTVAQVRGFSLHLERFTAAVTTVHREEGLPAPEQELALFIADARRRIAEYGEGNPRLELWGTASRGTPAFEFRLSLRPLPELKSEIALRTAGSVALEHPERKGANIPRFSELNQRLGAEAVLTDARGDVVEGATTALIWWEGARGFVAESRRRVPSVAERLTRGIAERLGTRIEPGTVSPTGLAAREVWAVNALHGIRPVTSVDGIHPPPRDEARLARFREAFDETWEAVLDRA